MINEDNEDVIIEYDENNNHIHWKNNGFEEWREYDKNNNLIHFKSSTGFESWWKHDNNIRIRITEQEFKQIERRKLYLNIKRSNRFELMDI